MSFPNRANLELALLVARETVYVAKRPERPGSWAPSSAITELIQGVWASAPEHAREILRNRIYSNATPSEADLGMVKIAAKRISAPVPAAELERALAAPARRIEVSYFDSAPAPGSRPELERAPALLAPPLAPPLAPNEAMALACELASRARREALRYASDRPIGAILVSREGELLEHALNTSARNRTLHAEVNLVQNWFRRTGRKLPAGSTLYVSLKSCKMCAAMLWCAAEEIRDFHVRYAEDDPGPSAHATVLTPGSFERRRASRSPEELALQLEAQLRV